jgi:metal-responsive CopG/Arc/MetJ family transcriptional regulator
VTAPTPKPRGKPPLTDGVGITRHLIGLTPRTLQLLDQYRERYGLRSRSAAVRHMIERATASA